MQMQMHWQHLNKYIWHYPSLCAIVVGLVFAQEHIERVRRAVLATGRTSLILGVRLCSGKAFGVQHAFSMLLLMMHVSVGFAVQ